MWMSVISAWKTAMQMQVALTVTVATPVHVYLDTLEMELIVMVEFPSN